jgi:serine/threonine protein phosphatase PrpC
MEFQGSGASRAGGDGLHNEDTFLVQEGIGLYVVCDGASESPAGEIAARIATDALEDVVERAEYSLGLSRGQIARTLVESAMTYALTAVSERARIDPALQGLSTTVTLLLAHGSVGVIGHRGDSRAYLIRRGRVRQLTVDLDLTEVVGKIGHPPDGFDVFALEFLPGDTIVLCTDGAVDVLHDLPIPQWAAKLTPPMLASRIVSEAHRISSSTDATVVVVHVRGSGKPAWLELSQSPLGKAFGHTIHSPWASEREPDRAIFDHEIFDRRGS